MCKFGLFISIFIFSANCFAQKYDAAKQLPRNEIGTHILSYSVYPFSDKYGRIDVANNDEKIFNILNGLSYKRFIDRHILRASFACRNLSSVNRASYSESIFNREGNYKESILKLGYERDLNSRKLTPYLAADLSMLYVTFKGFSKGEYGTANYILNGLGGGISPAFGLKYKLTNHLSLNAESCLDVAYFRFNHIEDTKRFPNATFSTYKFNTSFNPLQKLSVNVQF